MKLGISELMFDAAVERADLAGAASLLTGPEVDGMLAAPGRSHRRGHQPGAADHHRRAAARATPRTEGSQLMSMDWKANERRSEAPQGDKTRISPALIIGIVIAVLVVVFIVQNANGRPGQVPLLGRHDVAVGRDRDLR